MRLFVMVLAVLAAPCVAAWAEEHCTDPQCRHCAHSTAYQATPAAHTACRSCTHPATSGVHAGAIELPALSLRLPVLRFPGLLRSRRAVPCSACAQAARKNAPVTPSAAEAPQPARVVQDGPPRQPSTAPGPVAQPQIDVQMALATQLLALQTAQQRSMEAASAKIRQLEARDRQWSEKFQQLHHQMLALQKTEQPAPQPAQDIRPQWIAKSNPNRRAGVSTEPTPPVPATTSRDAGRRLAPTSFARTEPLHPRGLQSQPARGNQLTERTRSAANSPVRPPRNAAPLRPPTAARRDLQRIPAPDGGPAVMHSTYWQPLPAAPPRFQPATSQPAGSRSNQFRQPQPRFPPPAIGGAHRSSGEPAVRMPATGPQASTNQLRPQPPQQPTARPRGVIRGVTVRNRTTPVLR